MPVILIVVNVLKHHLTFFISCLYYVQNTGVGSLSLLQGIFPTQGSNPGLRHCRQMLYPLSHQVLCLCVLKYLESLTKLVSTEAKLVKFYTGPFYSLCSSATLVAPDMSLDHTALCSCQCPLLSDCPFSSFPTFDNKYVSSLHVHHWLVCL